MELEGKRIVVCGAGRGMGESILAAYVAEGADVVAMDVRSVDTDALTGPGSASYIECDVGDREMVDAAFAAAAERLGGLDVLVVTAGIDVSAPAAEIDEELLQRTLTVNLRGTIITNQAAYRVMQPQGGGAIINFGSDAGMMPTRRGAIYSTSKAAVHHWTRAIALEWGEFGIRANSLLPAMITPLAIEHLEQLSDEDRVLYEASVKQRIPLGGKGGESERDLCPVMVFLAGDGSRFITGQSICVNGGYGMVR